MIQDPPGSSYLDGILLAIRSAGQRITAISGYLESAERSEITGWKWQLLSAAAREHAEALRRLDEADERLEQLRGPAGLPALLDQLPPRLAAMRKELEAAEGRLQAALAAAAGEGAGQA